MRIRGIRVRRSQAIEVSPQLTTHTNRREQGKTFSVEFSLVTGLWLEGHKRIPSEREWSWGGHCTGQRPHIILKCFRLWRKPMGSGVQFGAKRQTVAKHSNLLTKIKFKTNCATNRNHCEKIWELVDIGVEDTLYLLLKLG